MEKELFWHDDWFENIEDFYYRINSIKKFTIPDKKRSYKRTLYRIDENLREISISVELKLEEKPIPEKYINDQKVNFYYNNLELIKEPNAIMLKPKNELTSIAIQKLNSFEDQIKSEELQAKNLVILNLVSTIEMILSKILEYNILYVYKENSMIGKRTITYDNIKNFSSIREVQKHLTESYIRDLSYKSFPDFVNEVLKICDTDKALKYQPTKQRMEKVNELCQRRNMIAHNNNVANSLYFAKVTPGYIPEDILLNEKIINTNDYLISSADNVLNFGVDLIARNLCSKKLLDNKEFEDKLSSLGLIMMNHGDFEAARILFYYINKYNEKYEPENIDHCFNSKFNYWLTFRLIDELEYREEEVKKYKNDIKESSWENDQVRLGFSALLDSKDEFQKIAIDFLSCEDNKPYLGKLLDWPIFKIIEKEDTFIEFLECLF